MRRADYEFNKISNVIRYNILNSLVNLDNVAIKLVKFQVNGEIKEGVNFEDTHDDG